MNLQAQTTVYILTRDRAALLRQALTSVLAQDVAVHIRVSDNSVGSETQIMLSQYFPQVVCLRRLPPLSSQEHFNAVLSEASTEFLVMFHDDDVMLPGFVRTLQATLVANLRSVAVGCNAGRLQMQNVVPGTVMGAFNKALKLASPKDLLRFYFTRGEIGPAPFPAYMYRTKATRDLTLERSQGGKYSDVSFLLKLLERGPILWLPEVFMYYRYHGANDSAIPDMNDAAMLIRFVRKRYALDRRSAEIAEFRLRCWLQWLLYLRGKPELAARYPWRRAAVWHAVVCGLPALAFKRPQLLWSGMQRLFDALRKKQMSW
jgi:glycosyltransferase involved in cell wall biosynthesis